MVSLQSALLPEAASNKRPPCLSLVGAVHQAASHTTATSKKRRRDDDDDRDNSRGEVVDGIELNFDAAPLPPEWQRCLDIQVRYYSIIRLFVRLSIHSRHAVPAYVLYVFVYMF